MAIIVLPVNIDFMEWATQLQQDLKSIVVPVPTSEDRWWEWAQQLLINNTLFAVPLPIKQLYPQKEDWRKWAAYFASSVSNT